MWRPNCKPYDARLMRCYPISTRINHVANGDAECSAPVELAQIQTRLFRRGTIRLLGECPYLGQQVNDEARAIREGGRG